MIEPAIPQSPGERLALLYRLSQTLNSSLDLDDVLNRVMDEVITTMRAERGFIMLTEYTGEPSQPRLSIKVARGMEHNSLDMPAFQVSRGVVERVAKDKKAVLTNDAQIDDRFSGRQSVRLLGLRSILCVPLIVKEEFSGLVYVDNRIQAGIFTNADLELLSVIASNAAVAIENARLFRETQNKLETLRLINEISANLTATLDLDRVLEAALQRVQDSLGAEAASILTIEGDELVFQIAVGEHAEQVKPFRIPLGQGIAGWAVREQKGALVNDVRHDPRFYAEADAESGFTTRCLLAAPLVCNERSIGVIEVFNKPGGFTPADLEMLSTIASGAAIAIENARLFKEAVEKGRMERELQVARRVQASLLPVEKPQPPGWDFAAHWQPAREVAGDYYDFIQLRNGQLGVVIADVMDKGMPAALYMAFTRSVFRASIDDAASPLQGILRANHLICSDSTYGSFVTLFYAQMNTDTGEIVYVNAGHNPPLLYRKSEDRLIRLKASGMPLGIDEEAVYAQEALVLNPGDSILMYTDGVTEATNAEDQSFDLQRLESVCKKHVDASAAQILDEVGIALDQFTHSQALNDDVTLVAVKRLA
ncbi:MAG: SpoIIE family protein phosphatase [Anaerolineales bacterium]|nr:SpoIIE family protein phosphatase [Anaerolineales bacterium]